MRKYVTFLLLSVASSLVGGCRSALVLEGPSADETLMDVLGREPAADGADSETLVRELRQACLAHPHHAPTLVAAAAAEVELGYPERARAKVEQALALEPENLDAVLLSVRIAAETGSLGAADRALERALRLRPDAAELHDAVAAVRYLRGQYQQAWSSLDRAAALDGDQALGWRIAYHRGLIAEARGLFEQAVRHYDQCLELEPVHEPARRRRAALVALGEKGLVPAPPGP